ncbi:MAG: hypothetical protein M3O30_07455 [Planctomycetota bacterium]|nr:hypothetical protein [Planctomycetota bacterium]
MKAPKILTAIVAFLAMASVTNLASAQVETGQSGRHRLPGARADGSVTLPYTQNDSAGNQWIIDPGGTVRMGGNQPVFSQGSMLTVNGNTCNNISNTARVDLKTGEFILDNLAFANCTVTRRILINRDDGSVRFTDIVKNSDSQPQNINLMLQSSTNYGVNSAITVNDPKHPENQIGWVGMTGVNRAAVEMYAGKAAKLLPTIAYQQGANQVQTNYALNIAGGKSMAVVHLMVTSGSLEQGQQYISNFKESTMLHSVPAEVRGLIVNFASANSFVGDFEILRGDVDDLVELRSGDLMRGTLKDDVYKLITFYGAIDLPRDQVIGIFNVGQYRPRQLVVTSDGEIFGGKLLKETIALEMASGQVVQIPLSQINRVGCRKRPGEPDEWVYDKPYVLLASGDRVEVQLPLGPIDVITRYGQIKLDPQIVAAIALLTDESAVHEIFLTDGSKFAGLVNSAEFDMKLAGSAGAQQVKFPASSIARLQITRQDADPDDSAPVLSLVNNDSLVGTLTGTLHLDTAFDTLQIDARQIKKIVHAAPGSVDQQVTLSDNSTVSGQFQEAEIQCKLVSGVILEIPLTLLADYIQPFPQPPAATVAKIKAAVADLAADDWKQRENAQVMLIAIGPPVISVLKDIRSSQPPEAQQRINAILKQLEDSLGKSASGDHQAPQAPQDRNR